MGNAFNCIVSEPIQDPTGHFKTFTGGHRFQTQLLTAPCKDCPWTGFWFCGQFCPITWGFTQCFLRRKILDDDMGRYTCCQGYYDILCFKSGQCGEQSCPDFCAFLEGCCCNACAISSSRMYTMERYDLSSDPCDYRLIRLNNCLQLSACLCAILALINDNFRECSRIINLVADLVYHCLSGCMTAQVAHEINYQKSSSRFETQPASAQPYIPPITNQPAKAVPI